MSNHTCQDCQGECQVCEAMHRHPAGKKHQFTDGTHLLPEGLRLVTTQDDPVNHPAHYTADPSGVECIQITRHRNFNIGNAIKYLWRAGLKDSDKTTEDLQKAVFYIMDEIARLEGRTK